MVGFIAHNGRESGADRDPAVGCEEARRTYLLELVEEEGHLRETERSRRPPLLGSAGSKKNGGRRTECWSRLATSRSRNRAAAAATSDSVVGEEGFRPIVWAASPKLLISAYNSSTVRRVSGPPFWTCVSSTARRSLPESSRRGPWEPRGRIRMIASVREPRPSRSIRELSPSDPQTAMESWRW
jgi:hypothetical protein